MDSFGGCCFPLFSNYDAEGGVWRVAFAFDHKRHAVLLIAGDKSGESEKRFYRELIRKADGSMHISSG